METHENIKRLREERGLSQEVLAEKVGYSDRSSIAKIEAGKVDLSQSKIAAFAAVLNVTPAQLMGLTDASSIPPGFEPLPETVRLPLVGQIACGTPITAEQNIEEYVDVPASLHASFVLRCRGDSMDPTIQNGDLVYIRKQPTVETGEMAAVRIGTDATLKRVYTTPSQLILQPDNRDFPPQVYTGPELEDVAIEGKVVGLFRIMEGH